MRKNFFNKLNKNEYLMILIMFEFISILIVTLISWMSIYSKKVFLIWVIPQFIITIFVLLLLFDKKIWTNKKVSFYISGFIVSIFLSYMAFDCLLSKESTYEIIMRLLPLYILIAIPIAIAIIGFVIMGIYIIVKKIIDYNFK